MTKTNYYYIDESGGINNNSPIFLHGCVITDTPNLVEKTLNELKESISNELHFEAFREEFEKSGFHAVDNHFDIRTEFYKKLPFMNCRAYFTVLNKEDDFFHDLKSKKNDAEILSWSLYKLLSNLILKHIKDENIFIFEDLKVRNSSFTKIIEDLFLKLNKKYSCYCKYEIVGKEEISLSVVDYFNYNLYSILTIEQKRATRAIQTFGILKERIGSIALLNNNLFLSRKKSDDFQVNYENIKRIMSG